MPHPEAPGKPIYTTKHVGSWYYVVRDNEVIANNLTEDEAYCFAAAMDMREALEALMTMPLNRAYRLVKRALLRARGDA